MPKSCGPQRKFKVPLSFFQELRGPSGGPFVPLSNTEPDPGVTGVAKIHFNDDLSEVRVVICIFNALVGNTQITMAHFHVGSANFNGPVTAFFFENPAGVPVNGLLADTTIRNENIIPVTGQGYSTNSVASLYEAIRQGLLYVNVHGSGVFAGGIVRGQVLLSN